VQVDLAVVSRVARRVDIRDIRLIGLNASLSPGEIHLLEPDVTFECSADQPVPDRIVVICNYHFTASSGGATIADVQARYLLIYELLEFDQEIEQDHLQQFAHANGTYHSWPFLRQLLFDLTAKMGLPPLTLPVFKVLPREARPDEKGAEDKPAVTRVATKGQPKRKKKLASQG
jgi:preprotein translocase subunit SecB